MTQTLTIENKAAGRLPEAPGEAKAALAELSQAFEAFKETNDTRLAGIDARLSTDVLTEDGSEHVEDLTRVCGQRSGVRLEQCPG